MKKIIFAIALITAAITVGYFKSENTVTQAKEADLVVHEWGTFTSIAGKNGVALDWRPLNGASDLPGFVYTEDGQGGFRGTHGISGKGIARVRMETPVVYFYSKKEMDVDVSVSFPEGKITEWYPQAGVVNDKYAQNKRGPNFGNGINWGTIKLLPNEPENFLREAAYSHYYPARETDAVQIQVCNADKSKIEHEKFLFYRGVGNFDLPLDVKLTGDKVMLSEKNQNPAEPLVDMIIFEKRGTQFGFRYVPNLAGGKIEIERPKLGRTTEELNSQLEKTLTANGLYLKEAKAMIKTWADSWFEEGLRVFYIVPRRTTDKVLPLYIKPQPREMVRVLVGRAEVITPEMEGNVKRQVALLRSRSLQVREAAQADLKKYGRFYEPILRSILIEEKDEAVRQQIEKLIAES